jgi:nicotinic acid phosphoribosyltransferase
MAIKTILVDYHNRRYNLINKKPLNERALRLIYIRALEKFAKRTINLIKAPDEDFHYEKFKKKVIENHKEMKKVKVVRLDSGYMSKLEEYVKLILSIIDNHSKEFIDEKNILLKEANLLHKEKNKNIYKKDKHSKHKFNDGY